MQITVRNNTPSPVVVFSVDSISNQERREGAVRPGVENSFYVPGGVPFELRIKNFNTGATILASGFIRPDQLEAMGSSRDPDINFHVRGKGETVTTKLSGLWTYRSFNPTYVTGDQTPQEEWRLIRAEAVFNLQVTGTTLAGTIDWTGPRPGGLNLTGTLLPGVGDDPQNFNMVGTGRPGTNTAGWQYDYQGHLTRNWPNGIDQRPALVGSVIRVKSHNGQQGGWGSPAGKVFSFIAVKQPPLTSGLSGSWNYRSFENIPTPVYQTPPQQAHLIWHEAVFKLETPFRTGVHDLAAETTLQGAIEWPGGFLDLLNGTVQPNIGEPSSFAITGTGRPDTDTAGWDYRYHGHLTPPWAKPQDASKVDQVPALVGSVIRVHGEGAPGGYVAPFIAVKRS